MNYRFLFVCVSVFLGYSSLLQADGYTATYNAFPAYASGPSNDFVEDLSWNEMAQGTADSTGRDAKASFIFRCPGDSFLSGVKTTFSHNDRQFYFICRFLQDANKKQIQAGTDTDTSQWESLRGGNFGIYAAYTDYANGFADATLRTSNCKGTEAMGGALSRYIDQTKSGPPPENHNDRKWKYICRGMKDIAGSSLSLKQDTCQDFPQAESGDFTFTCPVDTVVAKMGSTYNPSNELRKYTFTCCKYGT